MKKIIRLKESDLKNIINESVKKIYEARLEGFRVDAITNAETFDERINYCIQMLGKPIGIGSSRIVFQIDDDSVLKLARNEKGIWQNYEEIALGTNTEFSCFPKILNGTDEKNCLWIISEFVLPIKNDDFIRLLRIPFIHIKKFIYAVKDYCKRKEGGKETLDALYKRYSRNKNVTNLFNDIYKLYVKYKNDIWDLTRTFNWGICNRNGVATPVILDIGFSIEVKNNLYKKE